MSEVLKRPTAEETDEDLLQMQEEYLKNSKSQKSTVEIHKMRKRTKIAAEYSNSAPKTANLAAGNSNFAPDLSQFPAGNSKFELDLGSQEDTPTPQILFPVRERPLVSEPELKIQNFQQFSSEDGFPEPLDLSDYYAPKSGRSRLATPPGKSFFATEFDRIHGNLAENLDFHVAETTPDEENDGKSTDFHVENEKYLKSLDPDKILELKLEISERFDPKLLDFLKNRHKNAPVEPQEPKKVSKFKASRMAGAEPKKEAEPEKKGAEPPTKQVEEMMNELEVLEEWKDREDEEKYNRLATDAIQLDLTAKFSRNLAQRQQKNAVKLFDNCKFRPEGHPLDPLLEQARSSLDQIKQLYLEEVSLDHGATVTYEFGAGLNPILDQCWCLVPIRRVLDAVEKRQGYVAPDDVEIVRLAVLWTLLLYSERKSAFFAFAEPSDFYVRLSEVYLIGPEILADDLISAATARLLNEYVLENAKIAKISIRLTQKIAGLDAFMPFFEQMLKNYEQYSMGDANFAQAILIGAYLNAPIGDSIEYRFALWSPKLHTIRQMTVSSATCRPLLEAIKKQISERENVTYEQHYVQYCSLLGAYVTAIRDNLITRDRNQLMFDIASFEIGKFVSSQKLRNGEKAREFQLLAEIIQKSIGDKLSIF